MEIKNLFVRQGNTGYEFSAEKLAVTNPMNEPIDRFRIILGGLDESIIEQDRYGNWTQLVQKGQPIADQLLDQIGAQVLKSFS